MKALVTFYSESGNTEKLARAIYEGIKESEKDIIPIKDVKDLNEYDLIFCGFPVQASSVPGKVASFIKNVPEGKNLAFFATHGSLRGGQLAVTGFHSALCLAPKANIIGTFGCRGRVKQSILDSLIKSPEHRGWVLEAQSASGHPDEADFEDGKKFVGWMIAKVRAQ